MHPRLLLSGIRGLILVGLAVLLCSCLERKEHLKIDPDGRLAYGITCSTDSLDELTRGDAMPQLRGGWIVDLQSRRDENGAEKFTLTAEATFKPGGRLPGNFASPADPDADLYTQFATTIRVERRVDGTYYHFARTYEPRPWATIDLLHKQYVDEPTKEFKSTDPEQWTADQRRTAIQCLADFEIARVVLFARSAFRTTVPEATPDRWLAVRREVLDCADHFDAEKLDQLLRQSKFKLDDRDEMRVVNEETAKFQAMLEDRLQNAVQAVGGCDGSQATAFMAEFARQRKKYQITEGLADDAFEITLDMPGEIIATNAENSSGGTAIWSFGGEILRDHEFELLATSFVRR